MSSQQNQKATAWLKPEQVDKMRSATVETSADYLSLRNDAIIALLYDTGLRVGELVSLDWQMLNLDDSVLGLPASIQKDYPNNNSPSYTRIELKPDTVRTLRNYRNSAWKTTDAVSPSRRSDRIGEESVRVLVRNAAVEADITPYSSTTEQLDATDVTPHTLRHSVAYRLLEVEEGNTLYDVTKRLRHATIQTTERVYSHFDRV